MLFLIRNKNIKIIFNYFLGPCVFTLLVFSIYRQIQKQANWEESIYEFKKAVTGEKIELLLIAFILMFINWGIEAKKWQLAIGKLQYISFRNAFRAVFTGTTMAAFTPNRTGEYLGRILYIEEGKRIPAISLTLVCSMAQLQITLYAGLLGVYSLQSHLQKFFDSTSILQITWIKAFFYCLLTFSVLLTFFFLKINWWAALLKRWKLPLWMSEAVKVLQNFDTVALIRILLLSLLRYTIFAVQYYLLFQVFNVKITELQTLQSVSILFLVLAVFPSFTFLTDLGIRWKAGIEVVTLFSTNIIGIFATAFSIWLLNLIIPALIGSLLILGVRVFRR